MAGQKNCFRITFAMMDLHFVKRGGIIFYMKNVVLTFFFAVMLCSCREKQAEIVENPLEKPTIVGFSQIGSESSWRTCNTNSIIRAAESEGFQVVYADAEQKQENQIRALRSFIVYRVDAILFAPIVESGWDGVLSEAKEAGIPVIVVDRKIRTKDKSLVAGFIGENALEEGQKAAEFLLKKYADMSDGEKRNILEITGTADSSTAKERSRGFREMLSEHGNGQFSVIFCESGDFLRSRGNEIISQIIAYNGGELKIGTKKIDIIFSHNDAMTLGILDALDKGGIAPGSDVTIVSVDGEQSAINELKRGRLNCVVECNPRTGEQLMKLVKTVLSGGEIPAESYVDEDLFCEFDNLTLLEGRGY